MNKGIRYGLVDTLRGIAVISMIFYHALWDMVYIFGKNWEWYTSPYARIWQQSICISFIFISGFCVLMGKSSVKRGITVLLCGVLISLFTNIFMPENSIYFGVLICIGSCMLIGDVLRKYIYKINFYAGICLSFVMFLLFRNINKGYILNIKLPHFLYKGFLMAYIGFPENAYKGVDYFSLIPWIFIFTTGIFTYIAFEKRNMLQYTVKGIKPLSFIGRHALAIYMIHQPVIYCLLCILFG